VKYGDYYLTHTPNHNSLLDNELEMYLAFHNSKVLHLCQSIIDSISFVSGKYVYIYIYIYRYNLGCSGQRSVDT
jgi:hypothetical protein